ncbi:MAG: anti-sigma F factor [Clostridia bacterium]|nr:anti-sigma F factor [Clostridia bacterium]
MKKSLSIEVNSNICNISVVRVAVSTFISDIPGITLEDITDVKTSISEAVSNCIEHAYLDENGIIKVECTVEEDSVMLKIIDSGIGIEDIELAITPAYTSKPEEEHAGLGFTIMENFMDSVEVESDVGKGTRISMFKKIVNKKIV